MKENKRKKKKSDLISYQDMLHDLSVSMSDGDVIDITIKDKLYRCVKAARASIAKKPSTTGVELACVTQFAWMTVLQEIGELADLKDPEMFVLRISQCCLMDRQVEKRIKNVTRCFSRQDIKQMHKKDARIIYAYKAAIKTAKCLRRINYE